MWATFRFGQRGATTAVLIMTAMAILGTARGPGPFQDVTAQENLWLLQTYGGVLAISTLVLTALVTENQEVEEGLNDCNQGLERRVAERSAVAEQRAQDLARSEEASREQNRTFESILDTILEGVVVADLRGESALWNPAAERLVGVGRRGIALEEWPSRFGCFLPDQITPYPADQLPLARALRGETVHGEDVFLCNPSKPDGAALRFSAVPLRNGGSERVGGVAVFRDVSESKQAELRLRSVIESALAGLVMVDEAGKIALVNRQAEVIFGYTREELYGQSIEVLVPQHLREDHRRHIARYLRDPQSRPMAASRDIRGLRKDGRNVDLLVALNPIRQDRHRFILASILDVTEQKRAADLVRSVVEFSPDGTLAVDRDGRIVLLNRQAERMFAYAREELLGLPLGILVPERFRDHHQELSQQFVAERRQRSMNRGRDLFARRKDGSEFPAPPALTGLDIAGISYPAAYAGGDMFNYLPMLGGNLGIVIEDVAGHGIGAALEMASIQAFLRSLTQTCATIGEIMTRANQFVFGEPGGESFVTLMLIRLDPRSRSLTYANAGHPPGYILDPLGDVRAELSSSTMPLGIEESCDFPVGEPVVLRPGEIVVLVTDGILEAQSPEGTLFGSERLLDVIRTTRDRSGQEILEELRRAVGRHTGTEVFKDDLTAVVIRIGRGGS
jgi:PAS domain S-box-containing protein